MVSAIYNQLSLSAGQFHYQTRGFRENNHLNYNIYNFFAQAALTPQVNVQAEVRRAKAVFGDLMLSFDPDAFDRDTDVSVDQDVARLGFRYSPSPASQLIASVIYSDQIEGRDRSNSGTSTASEAQYILDTRLFNGVFGGGRFDTEFDFPTQKFDVQQNSGYGYWNIHYPETVTLTVGLAYDDYKEVNVHIQKINPKLGFQWDVTESLASGLRHSGLSSRPW